MPIALWSGEAPQYSDANGGRAGMQGIRREALQKCQWRVLRGAGGRDCLRLAEIGSNTAVLDPRWTALREASPIHCKCGLAWRGVGHEENQFPIPQPHVQLASGLTAGEHATSSSFLVSYRSPPAFFGRALRGPCPVSRPATSTQRPDCHERHH